MFLDGRSGVVGQGGEVTRLQMATRPTGSAVRLQKGNFMSRAFEKKCDPVTFETNFTKLCPHNLKVRS